MTEYPEYNGFVIRTEPGTVRVTYAEDVDAVPHIRQALADVTEEYSTDIKVDFTNIQEVDTSVLGALNGACKRLRQQERDLIIYNPSKRFAGLLDRIGLNKVFTIEFPEPADE